MNSQQIRDSFLDFFAGRGHRIAESAPLVPQGDPTLLFTNAGMVQFKDVFLGRREPEQPRAVSVQKCLRVSGKHNDLENVGPSPRHHTFFEMLGNFSFGDYFKEEAIALAWELVTGVWELPASRLAATVFEEDDEAFDLWRRISGLPESRIHRCGAEDNFWAMAETGPCGPCSEIYIDLAPGEPEVGWEEGTDSGRLLEIWNLVFMQFDRDDAGEMRPLPSPSIDTGAGLERVASVLQGVASNYDTDLFQPLIRGTAAIAGTEYGRDPAADVALRVVADHLRAAAFLLADGVIPTNDGRGYVLRRLLRRAVRHGSRLGFEEPFLSRLVPLVREVMGRQYPELERAEAASAETIRVEEEKFLGTMAAGARLVQEAIEAASEAGQGELPGEVLFRLYDTHGLPLELIAEIAEEERIGLDRGGFEQQLERQRQRSRAAAGSQQDRDRDLQEALESAGAPEPTRFLGYDQLDLEEGRVLRMAAVGEGVEAVESLGAGQRGYVVVQPTVFYAEGGGQVGDTGRLRWEGGRARVLDTQKDSRGVHRLEIEVESGELAAGTTVEQHVDAERRRAIERHHTATHLLHAALREVLGESVRQAGSLVAPDRLRFDFTFSRPLERAELVAIEDLVNGWTLRAVPRRIEMRGYREAIDAGAMALFGEKYGDTVRTVEIPGFSLELCGGCHVDNTGAVGAFLITGERGVASGVRRIEAVAGAAALDRVRRQRREIEAAEEAAEAPIERLPEAIGGLRRRQHDLEGELRELRTRLVAGAAAEDDAPFDVDGVRLLAREVPAAPGGELRHLADRLRDRLGSGAVVLVARGDEKVQIVVTVSQDLQERLHAGELARALAERVGGSGGGRADFAQAGGRDPQGVPAALAAVPELVRRQLEG